MMLSGHAMRMATNFTTKAAVKWIPLNVGPYNKARQTENLLRDDLKKLELVGENHLKKHSTERFDRPMRHRYRDNFIKMV